MDPARPVVDLDGIEPGPTPVMVWGRAAVLGTVASAAGVVSHAVAGGRLPGPVALLLLTASCVLAAALLLLRRAGALKLALAVLAGQTWAHGVLSAVAGHRGDPGATPSLGGGAVPLPVSGQGTLLQQYRDQVVAPERPGQDWLVHQVDHLVAQGPLMVLAHLGGALAVGLFLAVGEDALWGLLRLARVRETARRRQLLLGTTVRATLLGLVRSAAALVVARPQVLAPQVLARATLRHRGPPFVLAA